MGSEGTFYDLIYDDAAEPVIRERFPHVVVEDARDFIHEDRISITLPESDRRDYIKHSIRDGYHAVSLTVGLMQLDEKSAIELRSILDELNAERAPAEVPEVKR